MAMSVHTNSAALTGTQHLMKSTEGLNKTMERLSTGMKINSAADDASGLVTSEYQRSHISGLKGGISNIDRAVAMVQTAESGMQEVNSLLIKLREVAVNSANAGTLDDNAMAANQATVANLLESIDRIADTTKFGTKNLLDGTAGSEGSMTAGHTTHMNFTSSSSATVADSYEVIVTEVATQAKSTGIDSIDTLAVDETLTINGVKVTLDADSTAAQTVTRINQFTSQTGVTASLAGFDLDGDGVAADHSQVLVLTQTSYGDDFDVEVYSDIASNNTVGDDGSTGIGVAVIKNSSAGASADIGDGTAGYDGNIAQVDTTGVDAEGTIGGQAATGVGNVLTGKVGENMEGLVVTLTDDATKDVTVATVTVTDNGPQFQIGAFSTETASVNIASVETENLGTGAKDKDDNDLMFTNLGDIQVDSAAEATDAIGVIDKAIEQVSTARGTLGSFQSNTLEATQAKMRVELKNLTEAESQIRDTDFETEIAEFTAAQIRQQVATAVLSSANQQPQMILSLLRG